MTQSRGGVILAALIASASTFGFVYYVRSGSRPPRANCESDYQVAEARLAADGVVRRPPAFVADDNVKKLKLEANPTSPDYDPGKLGLVVGLEKVFKAEPRDAAWAEKVEGGLGPRLETALKSLTPEVLSLQMECRTMVCHLRLQLTPDASPVTRKRLPQMLKQLYPGPSRPVNEHTYYVLWRHDSASNVRDLPTFLPAAKKQIETMTRFLRSPEGGSYLARFDR